MGTLTVYQQLTGTFTNTYGGFAQSEVKNIVGTVSDFRVAGPVGSTNFYAMILVVLVPLAWDRLWQEKSWPLRFVALWSLVVCVLSIIFTFSRGGFLALSLVGVLILIHQSARPCRILLAVGLLALLLPFIPANYTERLTTTLDIFSGDGGVARQETHLHNRLCRNSFSGIIFHSQPCIFARQNKRDMTDFLAQEFYGNTVQHYIIALAIIVGGILLVRIFRNRLLNQIEKWTEKTETKLDGYIIRGIEKFGLPILVFVAIYSGLSYLTFSEKADKFIDNAMIVVITLYVIRLLSSFIRLALESFISKQEGGQEKLKQLNSIMLIVNAIIWAVGLLFLFDNLGYNVTTIIAGLGIGGIAIALAAQNILGDLFNYFVIFFDRPFEVGDFITVDDKKGTVEHIGIKTTRLLSVNGEQLAFSNSESHQVAYS